MTTPTESHSSHEHPVPPARRNFLLEFAAIAIGGIATMIPASLGAVFFLNPLIKKKKPETGSTDEVADDGFRKVGSLQGVTPGGVPVLFPVVGTRVDAWTTYPATTLGKVYIQRDSAGELLCHNVKCPHLGCDVTYQAGEQNFLCPCHASAFTLAGAPTNEIPPRNLDELEVEIRNGDEIWVKFEDFVPATDAKIPIA